jgi:uncharacterized protein YbaR (Trm112 family)
MKPWLLDILACPIDKYFPLKLYIFSYETNQKEFLSYLETYERRDLKEILAENFIDISRESGTIFLKDNVIFEKNPIDKYFKLLLLSIDELHNVLDKSPNEYSKKCITLIKTEINNKLLTFSTQLNNELFENYLPELYLVNHFKTNVEIKSGLLFCEKCHRWYPIINTIPQMLPDEYRDKEKETQFLLTNKNLLDETFFNQVLKPFNINT